MPWLGIRGNGTLSHALPRKFRLAVVGRLAAAPVCWRTELERGQQQGWTTTAKPQPGQPTGARPRRTAKPGAETSPDLPAAQEQAGDPSATGESTRRNYAAGGTWRTAPAPGPPPPRLPGATDGNHGESTGTYSKGTLAGRVFRVEPPEDSLLTEPPMQRAK